MRQDGVRAQRREQTRQALLGEGRRLFSERGYADVGLAEIVAAAGVTKGALYHHFAGKTE
ncbi:TetR family transcriptional regulator, partial [Streptomyces sp. t39]